MYPAVRMFRERILGSTTVSSASGVWRRRPKKSQVTKLSYEILLYISEAWNKNLPTTSSWTSFHSMSPPDSWTMVTVSLLCKPCGCVKPKETNRCLSSVPLKYSRFTYSWSYIPGAIGMCHDMAFLLCGPLLQGCSWEDKHELHWLASVWTTFIRKVVKIIVLY